MTKSSILSIFGGKFIRIYTDITKKTMDTSGIVYELPIIVEGYLMDEDDDYYYLAYDLNPDLISQAIRKTKDLIIEDIELVEQQDNQELVNQAMAEKSGKVIN